MQTVSTRHQSPRTSLFIPCYFNKQLYFTSNMSVVHSFKGFYQCADGNNSKSTCQGFTQNNTLSKLSIRSAF